MSESKKATKAKKQGRIYFRGVVLKPTRVAGESEVQLLEQVLKEYHQNRSVAYKSTWIDDKTGELTDGRFRIVIGCQQALRSLRQGKTKVLFFSDRISGYLKPLLIRRANELNVISVEVSLLDQCAKILEITKLTFVSFIECDDETEKFGTSESSDFNKIISLFIDDRRNMLNNPERDRLQIPQVIQVQSTGTSSMKKQKRKAKKQANKS